MVWKQNLAMCSANRVFLFSIYKALIDTIIWIKY